jgi:hypothetical protein
VATVRRVSGSDSWAVSTGEPAERSRSLDEFTAVSDFHRKHAMRLLWAGQVTGAMGRGPSRRVYDDAVHKALIVVGKASDLVCGKRLRPLLPCLVKAMERHGNLRLAPEVRTRLFAMSAAIIDRGLREIRRQARTGTRLRSAPSRC